MAVHPIEARFAGGGQFTGRVGIVQQLAARFGGRGLFVIAPYSFIVDIKADYGAVGDGVTDDGFAFKDFKNDARLLSIPIVLKIPPGSYLTPGPNLDWMSDITPLVVLASGATMLSDFRVGGANTFLDNVHIFYIETVWAGSSTIQLVTPAEHSNFSAGERTLITAYDLQNGGFPANPLFQEYIDIESINTATGQLTLTEPLVNTYKSTYPLHNVLAQWLGGPAAIFKLHQRGHDFCGQQHFSWHAGAWGAVSPIALINCITAEMNDIIFHNECSPSEGERIIYNRCTFTNALSFVEVDKQLEYLEMNDCTIHGNLRFQSVGGATRTVLNRVKLVGSAGILGCPFEIEMYDCIIPSLQVRPGYGRIQRVYMEDCVIGDIPWSTTVYPLSDFTHDGGGVLRRALSFAAEIYCPGQWLFFSDVGGNSNFGEYFKIIEVTQDGTDALYQTNKVFSSWPPTIGGSAMTHFRPVPAVEVTAINCTGSVEAVELSLHRPGRPLFERIHRELVQSHFTAFGNTAIDQTAICWGNLVELRVNVTRAYTGVQGSLICVIAGPSSDINTIRQDTLATFPLTVNIDLKTVGERVITKDGVTGEVGADNIGTPPGGVNLWITGGIRPMMTVDVSGEAEPLTAQFTVTLITDQGLPNAIEARFAGEGSISPAAEQVGTYVKVSWAQLSGQRLTGEVTARFMAAGVGTLTANITSAQLNASAQLGGVGTFSAQVETLSLDRVIVAWAALRFVEGTVVHSAQAIFAGEGSFRANAAVSPGEVIFYDFPIGRDLRSDYGIRGSKLGRRRLVIGRR